MGFQTFKTVSRRAATVVGAVVITAVVVAGSLDVAQAATGAVANNSVNSAKIVNNSVQGVDIKDGTLTGADVQDNTLAGADVSDNSLTGADIASNAIGTFEIADQNVNYSDLNPNLRPLWAHIDGGHTSVTLESGRGVLGVSHTVEGRYDVSWNRDVSACGYTVTRTDNGSGAASPGFVTAELGATTSIVSVRTWNTAGGLADTTEFQGFTIEVDC